MNNDLISRSELKKALEEDMKCGGTKIHQFDKGYDLGIKTAIEMLDNASTIEKRAQGEWIIHNKGEHNEWRECPYCNNHKKYYAHFCDYCGAEMRKENRS